MTWPLDGAEWPASRPGKERRYKLNSKLGGSSREYLLAPAGVGTPYRPTSLQPGLYTTLSCLQPGLYTTLSRLQPGLYTTLSRLQPGLYTTLSRLQPLSSCILPIVHLFESTKAVLGTGSVSVHGSEGGSITY